VRATDCGDADGRPYLVMDFIEGMDLAQLVHAFGRLPTADAAELARQAALGLEHIHGAGVIHRDVKPSNLRVTPAGELKVLDLGLARLRGGDRSKHDLTDLGQLLGTVDYLAPEQAENPRRADVRSDLYSLGCTLYYLLTGAAPFDSPEYESALQKVTAHSRTPPPALRARRPDAPEGLAAVVHRLLAKDPARRYASADEVARLLVPHTAGCDLPALLKAAGEKVSLRSTTGTAGPDDVTDARTTEQAPAGFARNRTRRRQRVLAIAAAVVALVGLGALGLWGMHMRDKSTPGPEELKPGEWHALLEQPPTKLIWPHKPGLTRWTHYPESREVWTSCSTDTGLLRVGGVRQPAYKLRVNINQARWGGGVGVFFGYGDGVYDGKPCVRYQFVELRPYMGARDPKRALVLLRGVAYARPTEQAANVFHQDPRGSFSMPVPAIGAHLLELDVDSRGLVGVRWDGADMPTLTAPAENEKFTPADYVGDFGTLNCSSEGSFQDFRILLGETDHR
jgi:hypothetical protein